MPYGFRTVAWCFVAATLTSIFAGAAPQGGWYTDFASAQAEAKRVDHPILVHFGADWCAPCKRMEREVLHKSAFLSTLSRNVVPVKVDVDRDRSLARQYGVESVPTDLFLSPDGRVLGVMNGFRTSNDYLARVSAIDTQYRRQKELFFALSEGDASVKGTSGNTGPRLPSLRTPDSMADDGLQDPPSSRDDRPSGPKVKPRADGTILVGLKGHCPVTLYRERKWVKGSQTFKWEHQGLTYFLATTQDRERFQMEANRYAPRLLGCDPVIYIDKGIAIPGSTDFAVYYDEALYLFKSAETRAQFREAPERYTRRETVLLIHELESALR